MLSTSPAGGNVAAAGIFDGFDIDWEWPGSANAHAGNTYSPADTENYTALLAEFRSELNALGGNAIHYVLTAALPAGPSDIAKIQGWGKLLSMWTTAMSRPMTSTEPSKPKGPTNYAAPLYDSPSNPAFGTGFTVSSAISTYLADGFPANQLVRGILSWWCDVCRK